jgi:hypothetical protein
MAVVAVPGVSLAIVTSSVVAVFVSSFCCLNAASAPCKCCANVAGLEATLSRIEAQLQLSHVSPQVAKHGGGDFGGPNDTTIATTNESKAHYVWAGVVEEAGRKCLEEFGLQRELCSLFPGTGFVIICTVILHAVAVCLRWCSRDGQPTGWTAVSRAI